MSDPFNLDNWIKEQTRMPMPLKELNLVLYYNITHTELVR